MMRLLQSVALLGLMMVLAPTGPALAEEADDTRFFMVKRVWVENVREKVDEALTKAHNDHIAEHSVSVISSNLLDRDGEAIGVVSIKGYDSWEEVEFYVYEDPYTKAGLYSEIEIDEINLYVLNATFARAPDWYRERFPERAAAYTPPAVPAD